MKTGPRLIYNSHTQGLVYKTRLRLWMCLLSVAGILCVGSTELTHAQPAILNISTAQSSNAIVTWNTGGALQFASSVLGPWTTVTNGVSVSSSNATAIGGPARFFRVVDNGVAGSPVPLFPNALPSPLVVNGASLQLLGSPVPAGNTQLTINVAPGQLASSNVLTLLVNNRITQLTGNSNNVFSGVVDINPSDLIALNNEITNLPVNSQITEVFSGRSILGTNVLQEFPVSNFLSGQTVNFFTNDLFGGLPMPCSGSPTAYDASKVLMITDLSVVQDHLRTWDPVGGGTKMGPWTFGTLMSNMANTAVTGITPSDFVLRWLSSWQFPQTINNDTVGAVVNVQSQVVAPWQAATASEGGFPAGAVDLSIAPFRLLAIVNRVDLRSSTTYGGTVNNTAVPSALGGEARFVFGVLDSSGNPLPFTVILEYAVPFSTCSDIQNWGAQWAGLNAIPFGVPSGNPTFNILLQAITDQFTAKGADPSRLPNMSAIHQVRANEILGSQWELRQFNIDNGSGGNSGFLVESPVAGTPAFSLNGSATLNMFLLGIPSPASFCPGSTPPGITVPTFYNGAAFLGGSAPEGGGVFWDSDSPTALAGSQLCVRHIFSLNTCNGCHTTETATPFLQVSTRAINSTASLSGFLTGETVFDPDPANSSVSYVFNDLARRVQDLNALVTCPCPMQITFFPILQVH